MQIQAMVNDEVLSGRGNGQAGFTAMGVNVGQVVMR